MSPTILESTEGEGNRAPLLSGEGKSVNEEGEGDTLMQSSMQRITDAMSSAAEIRGTRIECMLPNI